LCEDFGIFAQAPVNPGDHVPDLEPGVLDAHGHAVLGARAGEGQQMPAGLEHAQALGPDVGARDVAVPALAHERKPIWRIGDDGVDGVIRHAAKNFKAVAVV